MSESKALSVEFFYEDPPSGYFSPEYPIIGGTGTNFSNLPKSADDLYLKIKFLQKLDKVDTINIIFSGEINITFEREYAADKKSAKSKEQQGTESKVIITESERKYIELEKKDAKLDKKDVKAKQKEIKKEAKEKIKEIKKDAKEKKIEDRLKKKLDKLKEKEDKLKEKEIKRQEKEAKKREKEARKKDKGSKSKEKDAKSKEKDDKSNKKNPETESEILTETLSLFKFTQNLFDNHNSNFEKDQIIILKFIEFKFPSDKLDLPSSYEFSSPAWKFSINYGLTFDLQRPNSVFHKHYRQYLKLNYQSGGYFDLGRNLNYLDSNISLKGKDAHCFKKKPRRFILDEGTNLVENPLNGSHRHTRIIRSMFDDNYKNSNYRNLTKDVGLILKFRPNSFIDNLKNSFDIADNFVSQLGVLRIETNSISNDNLVPDYIINNKSTELGKFHFKYLKIYMIDNLNLHCKGFASGLLQKRTALIDNTVYKKQAKTLSPQFIDGYNNNTDINDAKSNNLSINTTDPLKLIGDNKYISISFDLCNFKQDPDNEECYFTEMNISELLKNSSSSLSFPKPILTSFNIPDCFENDVSIEIEIGIDSRFKDEEVTKIYKLNFGVILTNNSILPYRVNQQSQYNGSNSYNNDYVTGASSNNSQYQYINNNSYNNTNDIVLNQAPALDPNPLSHTQNLHQQKGFQQQQQQQQQQQHQGYSSQVYPSNNSITAASRTSNTSYYGEQNSQLSQKYQKYNTRVSQVRNNNNRLHESQSPSQPLSNSSTGMTNGYYNTEEEEEEEDLPPPEYNQIFDSYETRSESPKHSTNHVAN